MGMAKPYFEADDDTTLNVVAIHMLLITCVKHVEIIQINNHFDLSYSFLPFHNSSLCRPVL